MIGNKRNPLGSIHDSFPLIWLQESLWWPILWTLLIMYYKSCPKSQSLWNHVTKIRTWGNIIDVFTTRKRSRNTCSISMFVVDKRGILSSFMIYQHPDFRAKLKMKIWWKSWVYEKICDLLKYILEITVRVTRISPFTLEFYFRLVGNIDRVYR